MSEKQDDQSTYMSDLGMIHRLKDARTLWIKKNVNGAYLQIEPLKPENFPQQFRKEAIWVHDNFTPKVDWAGDVSTRTAQFIDAVLQWHEENQ